MMQLSTIMTKYCHPNTLFTYRVAKACVVALAILLTTSVSWAQSSLGIAAVVNDDVISMLDLNTRLSMIMEDSDISNQAEVRARIAPQVLRGLIDEKLKLQETRREGIKIPQKDIEANIQKIADGNKLTVSQLTDKLRSVGVPITGLTSRIEAELAWQYYIARRLSRRIQVGEEEINDEIEMIQANAGKPEYLLAEIFLPIDNPSRAGDVQQTAERLVQQLYAGASFSALAKNFSAAPSAAVGGDMGWVQFGNLDTELQKAVQRLKPKTISPPIHSLGGYYILMLRDVRTSPSLTAGESMLKLSQYHIPVKDMSDQGAVNAATQQLMNATRGMNSCSQLEAAGANSGSMMSGSLGEMKLSSLPDNLRGVLTNLPVGQPSQPVQTGGGLAVVMICERSDEGVDMDKIRENIRIKILESRVNVAAQRKLRDLRRNAFVDIRL